MLATVKTTQRLNFCKSLLALGNLLSKTSGKTNVGGSCFVMIFSDGIIKFAVFFDQPM